MKIVKLLNNVVMEILPKSTYEKGVEFWYGKEFASSCVTAPDDVEQNMRYIDGYFFPPLPEKELMPFELRKNAYSNDKLIDWDGVQITVDEANEVYLRYLVECSDKMLQIQPLIIDAKNIIREQYPDEEV